MHLRRCWIRSLPLLLPLLALLPAAGASAANWRDLQQVGDVAYFLVVQTGAASVERVQMDGTAAGTRLSSLTLSTSPSGPLAFFVDDTATIYVAYPDRIDRVPTNGDPAEQLVPIAAGTVALYGVGDFLFVVRSAQGTGITVEPVNKLAKTKGDLKTASTRQGSGFAFERQGGRVFAFASGSPGVVLLSFQLGGSDGSVGTALEASIPTPLGPVRLFPFPDGTRVADAGGTVYSATDLLPLDSFAGDVTSLAFRGDVPIVLRGAQIVSFSNTLEQAALKTLPTSGDPAPPPLPSAILVQDDQSRIYAFSDDNDKDSNGHPLILQAQSFTFDGDLSGTPPSGEAIDPHQTAFTPDGVAFDEADGTLYLLDAADLRLFRWGAAAMDYLPAVQLPDTPRFLAVSHANGTVYLGYSGGVVKQLPIGATTGLAAYVDVKAPLCGLVAADALVVTCQKGASAGTTTTTTTTPTTLGRTARPGRGPGGTSTPGFYTSFKSDTTKLFQVSEPLGSGFVWSSAAERLYFLIGSATTRGARGPQVAALPLASDGSFGTLVTSSVSSRSSRRQSASLALPIVPTSDGATLVLGSGQELDAVSLALLPGTLPAPSGAGALVDAATPGNVLWTFRSVGGVAEADQVAGDSVAARALFEGTPLRLFALGDAELVALGSVSGVPTPTRWQIVGAGPLAGTVRFDSTPTTRIFDLAALHYSDPGSNSELTFDTIDMSETGQVSANGQLEFTSQTPPETVQADLSGSLTGSAGSTTAQLHFVYHDGTLDGQPFSGTTDMKLTAFDAATNALTGTQTLNFTIGRQRLNRSTAASWALPAGVDGSWTLEVTLDSPTGSAITGSATLQVHPEASDSVAPGRSISVPLSGTIDAATGHATLSGSNGDASVSLGDVTPLARGVEGTVGVHWLGQDRSADLNGAPAD